MPLSTLDALKRIAHKAGFDEVELKEIELALANEHGTADEKKAAKERANAGSFAAAEDDRLNAAVEKEIARRSAAAKPAKAEKAAVRRTVKAERTTAKTTGKKV